MSSIFYNWFENMVVGGMTCAPKIFFTKGLYSSCTLSEISWCSLFNFEVDIYEFKTKHVVNQTKIYTVISATYLWWHVYTIVRYKEVKVCNFFTSVSLTTTWCGYAALFCVEMGCWTTWAYRTKEDSGVIKAPQFLCARKIKHLCRKWKSTEKPCVHRSKA